MKRSITIAALFAVPSVALAQPFPTVEAPTNLNPGATGTQNPTPPPASTGNTRGAGTLPPPRTDVIIVGPDGKVTRDTGEQPAENGYYISGGGGPTAPAEDTVLHAGPVPDLHVVRSGDTLWDICFYYFNNPWEWPKIWSYNPQITNPHWIYPGDLVRLLPRGTFMPVGPEPANPNGTQEPVVDRPLPAPARKLEVSIKQIAFVQKSDLDKSIAIDGAVDEKELLGDGDSVYLSYPEGKPPQVGQRYSIYLPGKKVKDGTTEYGSYVRVIGTLEVVSVKQDKRARGVIIQANREIQRGAKVGPLMKTYKNVPPVAPTVDAQGPIVGMIAHDALIGEGEIVFVGLNKKSGVQVGNRMFVVRRGDGKPDQMENNIGQDDRRFPARALGEIVIVEVGENVSIGLVTLSVQEISVGDIVMMQKTK
ncbi:MAG: LysM peptidoglycan-binding domain-containing protein [Deltaproteobacteria bacterium]|nr:LysM peptidoglycan-binding domain-containing protein [Deltaproteobacteria bacterium]